LENPDGRADNTPEAARTIDSMRGENSRAAMKVTGRRTDNQPEAVRTSVFPAERRAVPRAASCVGEKFRDGRADNQPEAARTIV
jgi:hypothetical protein